MLGIIDVEVEDPIENGLYLCMCTISGRIVPRMNRIFSATNTSCDCDLIFLSRMAKCHGLITMGEEHDTGYPGENPCPFFYALFRALMRGTRTYSLPLAYFQISQRTLTSGSQTGSDIVI